MIEYIEEIRNIIADNPKNYIKVLKSKGFHKGVKSNEHLVRFIEENTKLLANSIYTLKTKVYWILNNIKDWTDERVCCKVCRKPFLNMNIKKLKDGYRQTCSKKCARKAAMMSTEKTFLEKYGVKNAFQTSIAKEKIESKKEQTYEKIRKTKADRYGDPFYNNANKAAKSKIKKYGSVFNLEKCKSTWKEKYGCENPMQNINIRTKQQNATYAYNNIKFDSSWELAYYIWLVDNNIKFEYQPDNPKLWYQKDNSWHRYYPDFKLLDNNQLVELKGDNAFDENGNPIKNGWLDWKEKYECMLKNNVKVFLKDDIQQYIYYVELKFGKNFFNDCKQSND